MQSKEEEMLELFFNEPTKEWHFEEILKEAKIARGRADIWLKQFIKKGLIRKVKEKGRMPFYISNYESPSYKNSKKLFATKSLYESGFLNHLTSLVGAKTIIIFGSFSRSDWYKESDIDLFIYGNPEGLKLAEYETKLQRSIQVFNCQNIKDLARLGSGLIKNIINGMLIKGNIEFVEVKVNA